MQEALPLDESENSPKINTSNGCFPRMSCIHTIVLTVLSGSVVLLFVQVGILSKAVHQNQEEIASLELRLQNQTQGQIQELTQKVDQEHSLTLYQMAGTLTLLTCLLTMFHMSSHLRNYHEPNIQRKILAILWMSPIYAVTSFFSLLFPKADGYLAILKDFYEAYAIFTFLSFLIAVLGNGDRDAAVRVLARHAAHLKQPMRCFNSCYHPPPSVSPEAKANAVVTQCLILCMQFVLVRPITSIASFVSSTLWDTSELDWYKTPAFYFSMVTNISVFLAFRGLMLFYHAVHQDLQRIQPFSKFMTIKGIVFLTFWQGLLIYIVVGVTDDGNETASRVQNFLICLEMLFFSIAHWCVFPAEEWEPGFTYRKHMPGIGLKDFVEDVGYIMSTQSKARERRRNASSFEEDDEETAPVQGGLDDADDGYDVVDATAASDDEALSHRASIT